MISKIYDDNNITIYRKIETMGSLNPYHAPTLTIYIIYVDKMYIGWCWGCEEAIERARKWTQQQQR